MSADQSQTDDQFSLQPVPLDARKGLLPLAVIMLGFTFFSASMWTGGSLGVGLPFGDLIQTIALGNLLLGVYASFLGYIAAKTGLTTHLLAHYSFGSKGSYLPSLILAGTQVGWYGVGVAMFALPVQKITGIDATTLVITAGVLMTVTAYFGIAALTILSAIAVPSIALLGGYSVFKAIGSAGGIDALMQIQPQEEAIITFSTALTMCVGSFISGATLTPDFVRFAKTAKVAVIVTMVGFFIGNALMFIFGAAGATVTGESDISNVMLAQGLIIPAVVVLGLNIWTTNDNALYASGLGFANITGLPSRYIVLINGAVGTFFAVWLYNNFVGWLVFLSTTIPPIGGIIIADYFLLNRQRYRHYDNTQLPTINYGAIIAVFIGVGCGHLLPGIVPLNAVLGGAIAHTLISKVLGDKLIR